MPMRFLQYGLLFVPAVLYGLVLPPKSEALYTLYILIAVGLAVMNGFTRSLAMQSLLFLAEILWSSWLLALYGPFMLFVCLSVLYVYMYRLSGARRWMMLGIQMAAGNLALHWHYTPPSWMSVDITEIQAVTMTWLSESMLVWIAVNLLLLLTATLSWQGANTATSRGQLEHVYDELRHKHYELQEARAQLLSFARQLEDAAQAEERTRISRQLHDDIGHRLIRTKIMSEAALLTLPLNSEQGIEMVEQIRDQLAVSMEDMRNTLHRLQPATHASNTYALDLLLEEVGRDTGVKTNYSTRGPVRPLYPSTQIVLYKNAKEAITNALRHGNASSITLQLVFDRQEICMIISNDGNTPPLPVTGSKAGLGHEGMRERTQFIGGTIEVQSNYPYTVITRIPVSDKINPL